MSTLNGFDRKHDGRGRLFRGGPGGVARRITRHGMSLLLILTGSLLTEAGTTRRDDSDRRPQGLVPDAWIADSWKSTGPATGSSLPPTDPMHPTAWWEAFGDPDLNQWVEVALGENRDLRQAARRLESAMAEARIAGADLWPKADMSWNSQRQQQNFVGLPIPGSDDRVLTARFNSHALSFNLSWELDVWGRIRSGRKAAGADVEAAAWDLRAARLSLSGSVVKAWWRVAEARRQHQLAQLSSTNLGETAARIEARYERGVRDALDLRLARSSAATARALVLQREREHRLAVRQLEVLLGRYPAGTLPVPDTLPGPGEGSIPAGLPVELLERRPDLRRAAESVQAERARVRQARAALLPRIALTASGGRTSSDVGDILSNNFNVWSLAGNLAQPLFEGGRLRAGVARARARLGEVEERYVGTVLQALAEVENALDGEGWLREREQALREASLEAEAARTLAEDRYDRGLEPYLTVLEAQRRAWDSESQWLTVRRLRLDNRVELHLALGGDFGGTTIRETGK